MGTERNPGVVNFVRKMVACWAVTNNAKVCLLWELFVKSPQFLKAYLKTFHVLVNYPSELALEEPF